MIPTTAVPGRALKPWHPLVAALLLLLLFWLSYPYYRYFIDPDAVAYLTMARRAAEGDTWRLVNALWSPLHPAVVTGLIRCGLDALLAAQLSNLGAAMVVLAGSYGLFRRFGLGRSTGLPLLLALSGFLCYAVFKQLFCDLPALGLLLIYLNLLLRRRFLQRPLLWIAAAILMGLAAYTKLYSFYFLLLQFPLALYFLGKKSGRGFPWKVWITGFTLQLLLLAPLAGLMHQKYGFRGLSKSGALNTSWTLVGHKSLKPGLGTLIPPPYRNSPYSWEDPYLSEGEIHGRFESPKMVLKQLAISGRAGLQAVAAMNELSALLLAVYLLTAIYWWRNRNGLDTEVKLLLVTAAVMPLGYLMLHVEARYLWLLLPVGMTLGGYWIDRSELLGAGKPRMVLSGIFALSFLIGPAADMKNLFREGESVYKLAKMLRWMNVRGTFTSNDNPSRAGCLAYWTEMGYFTPVAEVVKREDVIRDMRRWNVNFYLHHQNGLDATTVTLPDDRGQPCQQLDGGRIPGLQIFLVNP